MNRIVFAQLKQYRKESILSPLFTILEVVMEVLIPFVTAWIIDRGIEAKNMTAVWQYGTLMLVFAFLALLFGFLAGKYASEASAGLAANLRDAMYRNIQTFAFSNIDKYSTAGLVTRMTTDVTNVQTAYQMVLRIATRSPIMLLSSIVMCFYINGSLSSIFVVAMIFLAVALTIITLTTHKIFNKVFRMYDKLNASVQENVVAMRVVKAFTREDYEDTKFKKAANNVYKMFVKAEKNLSLNNPVMILVVYGCILALSWFGAKMVVGGSLTTGQLTSMFSYIMGILMSLMMLTMVFVMIVMSDASGKRIAQVITEEADIKNHEDAVETVPDGSIDFDHVTFHYQKPAVFDEDGIEVIEEDDDGQLGDAVLEDIDLHIKPGETIGIIGGTGSGKSSLVNLISRLYEADEGEVRVGGKNVNDYDLETLRDEVSVVLQKNVLFSGTIADNLRWGDPDATDEEVRHAAELACADEFINRFPDGYDTWIEQGGNNVSGGQKQRLCIARALLKKPKVLILDDSTSAVDTATDAKIRKAFRETIPGTTKIIVAQRVSSIEDADRIIVMDDGKISGFGSHDELMENNDIYRDIYESQTQGGGDFDEPAPDDGVAA